MTDFAGFQHGAVSYPLPAAGSGLGGAGAPILRDLDPFTFYLLEFYASVITTHLGARMLQEASAAQYDQIDAAVKMTLPLNPEPFLTEEHLQFPLLACSRKSGTKKYMGQRKLSVDSFEVAYILPPCSRAEAEHLVPFLKGVAMVLDNRTEQGFDPAYTPTLPTGTAGELVWNTQGDTRGRAGACRVEIEGESYGGYTPAPDLFFPAVIITLKAEERSEVKITELASFEGTNPTVNLADPVDSSTVETLVENEVPPAPVAVGPLSPATGTKSGGTPVTIPCTGLVVGRTYRALFAGSDASNVRATSTTALECVTPSIDAYPTRVADVLIIDQDGQLSNTLTGAFTFTSP